MSVYTEDKTQANWHNMDFFYHLCKNKLIKKINKNQKTL